MDISCHASYLGNADRCRTTTRCSFVCDVTDPRNASLSHFAPLISWERFDPKNDSWKGLLDPHWSNKHNIAFSSNHVNNRCVWLKEDQLYRCAFIEERCCTPVHDGSYRAKVTAVGPSQFDTLTQYKSMVLRKCELLNKVENSLKLYLIAHVLYCSLCTAKNQSRSDHNVTITYKY